MTIEIGTIEAIFRYRVKSMCGESLGAAALGWHGVDGDRRHALRRLDERAGFPWLSATGLPDLVRFTPRGPVDREGQALPTHVLTPDGRELPVFGDALATEVGRRLGERVEMTHLRNGTFDDACISVITSATVDEVCRLAGTPADARRFRPNILVRSSRAVPFEEDDWVGGVLTFGEANDAPTVAVTQLDVRCAMVNIGPDDGIVTPDVLKAVVRAHENNAGVYGTVTRVGRLAVGQSVVLRR